MPRKVESRTIGGVEVRTQQMPPMQALLILPRVAVLTTYVLARAQEKGLKGSQDARELLPVVLDLAAAMSGGELQILARDLFGAPKPNPADGVCTQALVDGDWIDLATDKAINYAFEGSLPALISALLFVAEVNFLDFFGGALPGASGHSAPAEPAAASK